MADQKPVSMGLQLFPPPPKKATRPARKSSRQRAVQIPVSPEDSMGRARSPSLDQHSALVGQQVFGGRQTPQPGRESPITVPGPAYHSSELPRSQTSFSDAPTLVRSNSNGSHASIAKHGSSPQREEPVMRSIFPRYDPQLPLEHQNYYPTQASPTHIPRENINRRPYSPSLHDERSPIQSPMAVGNSPGRFPRGISEDPVMEVSSAEEVKELWKVVSGWKVSNSEGRTFCLKLSSSPEEPVHTLSSTTQAFYTLRIEPNSTSALMTMTRQDPSKPLKDSPRIGSSSKPNAGLEVMTSRLEESSRRLPPNDGLVALLYPQAAADMVVELANKTPPRADAEHIIAAAERECGRLVWDEDSGKNYLVHPALVTPFIINISSSPAWSRVEYTLEHSEMPRNLVRLIRDGTGGGFLEVDTGVASKIDCFYVVDVAICAVLLVAAEDEKMRKIERFEAPPSLAPASPKSPKSLKSQRSSKLVGKRDKKETNLKFEEFEMDLESQESMKSKEKDKKVEKIPGFFGLIWMLVRCFVWTITIIFKGLAKCIIGVSHCLTRKSK